MSSRNEYLTEQERKDARALSQTLTTARTALLKGEDWIDVQNKALAALKLSGFAADYFELRHGKHLGAPIGTKGDRILVAAKIGTTRLIDNIEV